jgi:hypothetical protein
MAGLISPPLFGKGEFFLRRIKLLLAVVAAMSMLMMVAAPAMANDWDWNDDRNDFNHNNGFNHNDFFLDDFDDFDDFDEDFVELDDCEFVGWDGDEAVIVCELDF